METFLGRYKNLIVLAAILFAQIIALAVQVRLPAQEGSTRLIRLWAVAAITPFEKAVIYSENWVRDTWHGYIYLRDVRKENQQLRDQIERMKLDEVRLSEDANMARRVQTLLGFKEQYLDTTVAAQVIGTSGSEQSPVIYIDKGSSDGIKPDMAVITPTGIVGKIVQVFPGSSQVRPINDTQSGVGVALKDTRLQGILKGGGNGATTIHYIMSDEKVVPGEDVITSGGDGIFPKGLPVGKVVSVEPGKDLFLNIRVIPSAQLDRLEDVLVVTKMLEKPPDTKDLGPIRAADILADRLPTYSTPPPANAPTNAAPGTAPAGATSAPGVAVTTKPNSDTTAARTGAAGGTQTRTAPPNATNAVGVTRPATSPGTNSAVRAPASATKPLNSGTTAQGAGAGVNATKPNTVKRVIVEPDPDPNQKPAHSPDTLRRREPVRRPSRGVSHLLILRAY